MNSALITTIMTKNVVCVSPWQKIVDVKHIYEKNNFHHHIPVVENNKLIGMVSLIDFMYRIKGAGLDDNHEIYNKLAVKDIMTTNPHFATSTVTIEEIGQELAKGNFRAIPIVDNDQAVIGIVSTADIIKYYLEKER